MGFSRPSRTADRIRQGPGQSLLAFPLVHGAKALDVGPGGEMRLAGHDDRPHLGIGGLLRRQPSGLPTARADRAFTGGRLRRTNATAASTVNSTRDAIAASVSVTPAAMDRRQVGQLRGALRWQALHPDTGIDRPHALSRWREP